MDASVRFDTQVIGALPVLVNYFERLRLGATINEVVPWEGGVPLGTVVEVMIANLQHPQEPGLPLRTQLWPRKAELVRGLCHVDDVGVPG